MRNTAVFDFGLPVEEQSTKQQNIHDRMVANPLYPDPPVTYVIFQSQITAQATAIKNALNGGKLEKEVLANATKAVQGTVRRLQFYVSSEANGDREAILSSGFDVSKEPTPVGAMPQATVLWIRNTGREGEVKVRVKAVKGKQFVEVQHRVADPGIGFGPSQSTGTSMFLLSGLGSLRKYVLRVRLHGPEGPGPWSDEQQFSVL